MNYICKHCGELLRTVPEHMSINYCTSCAGSDFIAITKEELERYYNSGNTHMTEITFQESPS